MADKIRVIVIGTGNVAGVAIRCLKGREDMELVGVWAHAETAGHLIGTDSGLLDLDEPNGVLITGDIEELYARLGQGGDQRRGGAAEDGLLAHNDAPLWRCSAYCNSVYL